MLEAIMAIENNFNQELLEVLHLKLKLTKFHK